MPMNGITSLLASPDDMPEPLNAIEKAFKRALEKEKNKSQ